MGPPRTSGHRLRLAQFKADVVLDELVQWSVPDDEARFLTRAIEIARVRDS